MMGLPTRSLRYPVTRIKGTATRESSPNRLAAVCCSSPRETRIGMKWTKIVPCTEMRRVVAATSTQNCGERNACLVVQSPASSADSTEPLPSGLVRRLAMSGRPSGDSPMDSGDRRNNNVRGSIRMSIPMPTATAAICQPHVKTT